MTAPPDVYLKPHEDRRVRAGHLWLFSNEIDERRTALSDLEPGAVVSVVDSRGNWLALAHASPRSLICARVLSRRRRSVFDSPFVRSRIERAADLRRLGGRERHCRLVFGESDGLPGLVIDRFGDVFVVQANTAGMDRALPWVLDALVGLFSPAAVVFKNDSSGRSDEGLPLAVETVYGKLPDEVLAVETDCEFVVDVTGGQKTGWFYDQRDNRQAFANLGRFDRVLDVFCYAGGWSVRAARAGAGEVTAVDSSGPALDLVQANASRNGCAGVIHTERADAFQALESLATDGGLFDAVILDPPAFVKRKKAARAGLKAYQRLNRLGLALVRDGGVLVSCSCSYHASRDEFLRAIALAARDSRRAVQVIGEGGQSLDHPVHPAMPETNYLKAFFLRVGERW